MILHLLKTDWQRLRKPVVIVWIILLLTTMPWLLHDPDSSWAPLFEKSQWNGSLPEAVLASLRPWWINAELVRYFIAMATVGLASALGMQGACWQEVSPLRRWQRVAAKFLSLLCFLILPQTVLGALVLQLHGFPAGTVLSGAIGTLGSLSLLYSASALFAYFCGSLWTWLAGVACLLGAGFMLSMVVAGDFVTSLHPFIDPWAADRRPTCWVLGGVAILALALVPRLFRGRPGTPLAVTSAVLAMAIAAVSAHFAQALAILPAGPEDESPSFESISAEIVAGSLRIDDGFYGSADPGTRRVIATVRSAGESPGNTFVVWTSGIQSKRESGVWTSSYPNDRSPTDLAAMDAALPAPLFRGEDGVHFGENNVYQNFPVLPEGRTDDLRLRVSGHVFRYEAIADLPLSGSTATIRDGDFSLLTRGIPSSDERAFLDVAFQGPALGMGQDPRGGTWNPSALRTYRFVLHFPKERFCIPLEAVADWFTPMPGGAAWARQLLKPWHANRTPRFDPRTARLVILKPVTLARIEREIEVSPPDSDESGPPSNDWMLSRNYGLGFAAYVRNHRPFRPDPATCTEAEFAPYLRTVSATFFGDLATLDLADYAPRFAGLMTLHSGRYSAAQAVELGTPESGRESVLGALREDPSRVSRMAAGLVKRDWQEEAKDLLLAALTSPPPGDYNWNRNQGELITGLALLEDPRTYPALLEVLVETGSSGIYETLRMLPGIGPDLDRSIGEISTKLSPAVELSKTRQGLLYGVFDAFRAPVSHGNVEALTKLIELWELLPAGISSYDQIRPLAEMLQPEPALPDSVDAWHSFLVGKTAADFTYDPLTRKWHAPSAKP